MAFLPVGGWLSVSHLSDPFFYQRGGEEEEEGGPALIVGWQSSERLSVSVESLAPPLLSSAPLQRPLVSPFKAHVEAWGSVRS